MRNWAAQRVDAVADRDDRIEIIVLYFIFLLSLAVTEKLVTSFSLNSPL